MSPAELLVLALLLALHAWFRLQAERHRVDEDGRTVPFRPWRLRLHPPELYPTPRGAAHRRFAVATALVFMVLAVFFMLRNHGLLA